jgi:outer membrane protein insertion porin family
MVSSALGLGLLLAATSPAPESPVASVRIEVPGPERFAGYLDEIRPGEPLRPAAVRHAVELLYATGEFADVEVEAEPGSEGVNLVFRPRPAPRLLAIRIEGEPVLDPKGIRRIARLRAREPLWPARLEQAAREIERVLRGRGYREARIEARAEPAPDPFLGADAVFRVQAGARARVGSATVMPSAGAEATLVRSLIRPRPGEFYERQRAERAAAAMRKQLASAGRWRAEVQLREAYDPAAARVDLVFELSPGPSWISAEFRGAEVPGSLRSRVEDLLSEGRLRPDVLEEAADLVEQDFQRRGHREVVVQHREEHRVNGLAVVYEVTPGPQSVVDSVRVVGDRGETAGVTLATRPGAPLVERLLDEDVRALTRVLEDKGYVEARVEVESLRPAGPVPVVFRVRSGPRTTVGAVTVEAPEPVPNAAARELPLRTGRPYRVREVAAAKEAVLAAYRDAGFLQAEVTAETVFSEDRAEASVRFRVSPGSRAVVDHVVVTGLDRTREEVVRRELLVGEDAPLGQRALLESQRRLGSLGIFERVSITQLDSGAERRTLVVALAEGPRTTFGYGIGYGERDYVRGSIELTRRNLFGMDRTLTAFARASFRASRFLLSYREPYLLGRRQELFSTVFREEEARDSFSFIRQGGVLQTQHPFTPQLTLIARYAYQDVRVFDVKVPEDEIDREFRTYTTSGPSFSLVNDTRDNPLDPRGGHFVGADVELSIRALGGDPFLKGFLQAAKYRRLSGRLLLAVSGRLGLARAFRDEPALPLPERFFAGGAYSIRGFDTDKVGPLAPSSEGELLPTGGNALLLGGIELRADLTRYFQMAVFSDAGNVYPLVSDMTLGDVRYTAGVGVRYKSSLGPIRVDWGFKLDRRPDEPASRVHFAIGHAF